jgi:hypothetical protein
MGRRKTPSPEHRSPHEQRLREVVSELVQEESQKAAYLAFAHELMRTFRQPPRTPRTPSPGEGHQQIAWMMQRRGPKTGDSRGGTRPRSDASNASRMCPQRLRRTWRGTVPVFAKDVAGRDEVVQSKLGDGHLRPRPMTTISCMG